MMLICGLQKNTLIDFPGRLAATVFLCGCNFQCPWCYSRELVLPVEIKKQPKMIEKEFFAFLKKRRGLLDGVVVCGGEPTIDQALPNFIRKIKKMGYLVKLDTNGSNPEMLKKLIKQKLIDYVAMDIKAPLGLKSEIPNPKSETNTKYDATTGVKVNSENIKKSIKILMENKVDYEFRSTVVPSIHTKEEIIEMAKLIRGAKRYYLQNFRPEKTIDPKFEKLKPYSGEYLIEIQKAIAPFFEVCQIR